MPPMSNPADLLLKHEPKHEFLVAIDSDGCAFDTMEIKHKECFIPNIIKHWHLQPVSKYARAAGEFVNLYSKWRGVNRFPALTMVFDLLMDWPEAQRRDPVIPVAASLRDWISRETKLSNPSLKKEVEATGDPVLAQALAWSEEVNATVGEMVHNCPPFPFVRESLEKVSQFADIIVSSSTPGEALNREWNEHGIAKYTSVIAGQEMGSKKEHLQHVTDGKYDKSKVIMIGDAPGDRKAAEANGLLFFPINPGFEDGSWERFLNEASDHFQNGTYDAEYRSALIADFEALLPDVPPWKK